MEDAKQQCLGDAAGSPHGAVQLGQSPVKLLRLLGANRNADFGLLLVCHGVRSHAAHGVRPHLPVEDERTKSETEESRQQLRFHDL